MNTTIESMMNASRNNKVMLLLVIMLGLNSQGAIAADEAAIKECAQEKVAFDGIKPLKYADVIGEPNAHVALNHQHPALCKSADDKECLGKAYLIPGNTVAVANTCGEYAHGQFIGAKTVSYGWVSAALLKERAGVKVDSRDAYLADKTVHMEHRQFQFKLTRGKDIPVCEAFLQRLNQTEFYLEDHSPYCGLPENDNVPGFALLKRSWVPTAEVNKFYNEVNLSIYDRPLPADHYLEQQADGSWRKIPVPVKPPFLDKYLLSTFVFDPRVDIDNDGKPDNVMSWNTDYRDHPECGSLVGRFPQPSRESQSAFIMTDDSAHIDMEKTTEIFGHPDGGYLHDSGDGYLKPVFEKTFRPIGLSMSIFEYRYEYYFNTFFDGRPVFGDFNDQRKGDKTLVDTLAVFLRKDHHTNEVCEYRLQRPR